MTTSNLKLTQPMTDATDAPGAPGLNRAWRIEWLGDLVVNGVWAAMDGPEKSVVVSLLHHANADRMAWPKVATIAHEAGLSKRRVTDALTSLVVAWRVLDRTGEGG